MLDLHKLDICLVVFNLPLILKIVSPSHLRLVMFPVKVVIRFIQLNICFMGASHTLSEGT